MKEYYDWDDGCYEKATQNNGVKKIRHSEEIKDELVSLMIKHLENHAIFELLELVVSAVATKEQEGRETRICEKICELINGTISVDTYADKEYVCGLIKQIFKDGGQ